MYSCSIGRLLFKDVPIEVVAKHLNQTKYLIYEDLWKKGYFITSGHKFGADFLVYLGDPILFHAVYIIRCIDNPREVLNSSELVAFARLGTSVKKKAVLASVNAEQSVNYVTMKWMDA